jgi:multiple sugar transport system substrate-binding protein
MTIVRAINTGEMAARNILRPLTPEMLAIMGDVQSDFPEQFWAAGDYKGQHYTIPLDAQALVLYYNKDMFEAAGLTAPSMDTPMTKEEFEAAADALNKDGVAGFSVGTGFQAAVLFQTLVRQLGGAVSNEAGTEATYNSDIGVQALQYVKELKDKYSPTVSGAGDPEVKVFQQGRAAMVIHGPWHISDMEKLGFVGYAPVPQFGDQYAVWGGSHQFALTTDDPAKQLAVACWISWASANSAEWAKAGNAPIRNSVRNSDQLMSIAPPVAAYAPSAADVILLTAAPGLEGALWDQFGPAIDAVLLGQQTDIQKALNDAAAKSDQVLTDNAAKYQ